MFWPDFSQILGEGDDTFLDWGGHMMMILDDRTRSLISGIGISSVIL